MKVLIFSGKINIWNTISCSFFILEFCKVIFFHQNHPMICAWLANYPISKGHLFAIDVYKIPFLTWGLDGYVLDRILWMRYRLPFISIHVLTRTELQGNRICWMAWSIYVERFLVRQCRFMAFRKFWSHRFIHSSALLRFTEFFHTIQASFILRIVPLEPNPWPMYHLLL